jgi:hypothetical protein
MFHTDAVSARLLDHRVVAGPIRLRSAGRLVSAGLSPSVAGRFWSHNIFFVAGSAQASHRDEGHGAHRLSRAGVCCAQQPFQSNNRELSHCLKQRCHKTVRLLLPQCEHAFPVACPTAGGTSIATCASSCRTQSLAASRKNTCTHHRAKHVAHWFCLVNNSIGPGRQPKDELVDHQPSRHQLTARPLSHCWPRH